MTRILFSLYSEFWRTFLEADVGTDNVKMDLGEISCEVNYAYTELAQVRIQGWASVLQVLNLQFQ
jgi:hypothetical protein